MRVRSARTSLAVISALSMTNWLMVVWRARAAYWRMRLVSGEIRMSSLSERCEEVGMSIT